MAKPLPGRPKVYRDPVHGDIAYPRGAFQELVQRLVDTETFQRLRSIRQNGVVNLVFPGAEHSRFTHSMGVASVAAEMYDTACRNSGVSLVVEHREDTILAALLHDVGHGPYSHLLEEVFTKEKFYHEALTSRILTEATSEIAVLLRGFRQGLPEDLVPYIDSKRREQSRWSHDIVSSQLDADRLDYLARDAYMTGVVSHQFDSKRLISFLGVKDNNLVVDVRARDVVENYLLALDQMYQAVYYHHTVRAASHLLSAIIRRAVALVESDAKLQGDLFPARQGRIDPLWALAATGNDVDLETYVTLDEVHVGGLLKAWRYSSDRTLADLCERFATRRFPKTIELPTRDFNEIEDKKKRALAFFRAQNPTLEADYYVDVDDASRLSYKRYSALEGSGSAIKLLSPHGDVQPIEETERSVVEIVQKRVFFSRLIVPDEETRAHLVAKQGK